VEPTEGYRLREPAGGRGALFCRLEHVVPWAMQGPHWEPLEEADGAGADPPVTNCSACGDELGDAYLLLLRHRGEHRIPDGFCSVDHLSSWVKAGGRWQA
jgi:hypothetical protein